MTGGSRIQWKQIAFLNMISRKAGRVDAIETNARVVSRNVKRSALIGALDKTSQNRANDRTEIHILTEKGTKSPQSWAQVIEVFTIPNQVAVALQRYAKAQDSGLGQSASQSKILKRQSGLLLVKSIEQLESSFDCFHSVKSRCWSRSNSQVVCSLTAGSSAFSGRRTCLCCHRKPMVDLVPIVLQTLSTSYSV